MMRNVVYYARGGMLVHSSHMGVNPIDVVHFHVREGRHASDGVFFST